ncbi:MAG: hypothetical protein WC774_04375 [Candidatus Gracilibacteria bacterium]|jgi:hypothetical protein
MNIGTAWQPTEESLEIPEASHHTIFNLRREKYFANQNTEEQK